MIRRTRGKAKRLGYGLGGLIPVEIRRQDLHGVGRTTDAAATPVQHMSVDHGCPHVPMTKKLLDRPKVVPGFKKMRCETMPLIPHAE